MPAEEMRALVGAYALTLGLALIVLWVSARRRDRQEAVSRRLEGSPNAAGDGRSIRALGDAGRLQLTKTACLGLALGIGFAAGSALSYPIGGFVGLLAGWAVVGIADTAAAGRRRVTMNRAFGEFLRDLEIAAASGELAWQATSQAVARTEGPLRERLERALAAHRAGTALADALAGIPELAHSPDYVGLLQALRLHDQSGASLAGMVSATVARAEDTLLLEGETTAKLADAKWTARILAAVPPVLVLYLLFFARWALAPLTEDAAGVTALLVGAGLWLAGIVAIWRLTVVPAEFSGAGQ